MNPRIQKALAAALVFVLLLMALLAAVTGLAGASHTNHADPRDTKGILDVERVNTGGKRYRPFWRTITYDRWGIGRLWDRGYILVHLDLRGDSHFEHFILISTDGRQMTARLYRDPRNKAERPLRRVEVWRRDKRSVSVRLSLRDLVPETRPYYRWFVTSIFTANACPTVCIDRVPDSGAVQEVLIPEPPATPPPVTPTPTPTEPDPSPTP